METFWSFQTAILGTIISFLLVFLCRLLHIPNVPKNNKEPRKIAPQVAGAWPLIGHLHLLSRAQLTHIFLGELADKYGPIFSMKLGVHQAFVVSDWKMAKECFTTNDKAIVDRPKSVAVELIGYNYAMFGLGPYGNYWRHMHRMIMNEILFNKQVELLAPIQISEVRTSINDIYTLWIKRNENSRSCNQETVKVEMKQWFASLTINMVVRMIAGKRYKSDDEEGRQSLVALRKFFELMGAVVVSDSIPFLKWLDIGGYVKEMKKTGKEIDNILSKWLEEHKRKKENSNMQVLKGEEQQDFMDVMLSNLQHSSKEDLSGFDADTVNKATCLTILIGATDTTTVTMTWALSLLLNNPHALTKAREELDNQIGRGRQVNESDTKNLVYLQAIVKETLRLYPAGPLSVTRVTIMDCVLDGYEIPKGSRVIMNLSKIQRDPNVWLDPHEFRPERFLTTHKDVDFRGQHFELLPFGGGRRICPGVSLGIQVVLLTLASLIHGFEVSSPNDEKVDMSESSGLTNLKATPLEVFLKPRLSSYE